MRQGISTEKVAELAGVELSTIGVWVHRRIFEPEHRGKPRIWSLAETLAIVLFAATMRRNRTVEEASREVGDLMPVLVETIRTMPPTADKLILVDATFANERWSPRIVTSKRDLEAVLAAVLRRDPKVIEVRDLTSLYLDVLEAHQAARSRAERVPA